jgi:methylated-DNA-protein-cysteine methyltransferase-like protein
LKNSEKYVIYFFMLMPFTQRVVQVIQSIPEGKVIAYGRVAALAGNPRGARQVSRILHSMSGKHDLPWHRVVNARGKISLPRGRGYELQRALLESEGVLFSPGHTIDLKRCLWQPPSDWQGIMMS